MTTHCYPAVTPVTLALFAGGSNDHNPIHLDASVARSAGYQDVFAQGMLTMAYLGRLLTDIVAQEDLVEFEVRFVDIVRLGEELSCTAEPQDTASGADVRELALEVRAGERCVLRGRATVRACGMLKEA